MQVIKNAVLFMLLFSGKQAMRTRTLTDAHCVQLAARHGIVLTNTGNELTGEPVRMIAMSRHTLIAMLKEAFNAGRDIDIMKTTHKGELR